MAVVSADVAVAAAVVPVDVVVAADVLVVVLVDVLLASAGVPGHTHKANTCTRCHLSQFMSLCLEVTDASGPWRAPGADQDDLWCLKRGEG